MLLQGGGGRALTELNNDSAGHRRPSIKFDAMLFIIIGILGYLLSYKLTNYLAGFKVEKHNSRLDIIFLLICVIILLFPMSKISNAKISQAENRNLAMWKPFINKNGDINYNFGRDYDKWFNDRFNCREKFLSLYIKCFVLPNRFPTFANSIWNKKENYFVNLAFQNTITNFNEEKIKLKLLALQNFLDKRNIKLVVFIVPDREFINDKEIYPLINVRHRTLEKLVSELQPDININFDVEQFKREEELNTLVFHNDHHFNEFGSYIVYKYLCKNLGVKPVSEEEFELTKSNKIRVVSYNKKNYFNGSLLKNFPVLNTRDELLDREYTYYDYKFQEIVQVKDIPGYNFSHEIYNPRGLLNEKLYIIHSSFGERVLPFLQTNYKHIINRRYNPVSGKDMSYVPFLSDMEIYKPDIVVILINTNLLKDILGLKLSN